jgi:hypothetical protein
MTAVEPAVAREAIEACLRRERGNHFIKYRLKYGTFVSIERRYLYVEVPKNACTSVKATLWQVEGVPRRETWPHTVHRRDPSDGRLSLWDLPPDQAIDVINDEGFLRFAIVRDPVYRLLLAYQDKVQNGRLSDVIVEPQLLSPDASLEDFVDFVCSQADEERDPHWMSQQRLLLWGGLDLNVLLRASLVSTELPRLLRRIGVISPVTDTPTPKTNVGRAKPKLSDEVEQKIRRAFKSDEDLVVAAIEQEEPTAP